MATRKTTKPEESADTLAEARALVDLPDHDVKSGELLRDDVATVTSLASTGQVDMHPDAVAYAKATRH
jgi:hypothetical protein